MHASGQAGLTPPIVARELRQLTLFIIKHTDTTSASYLIFLPPVRLLLTVRDTKAYASNPLPTHISIKICSEESTRTIVPSQVMSMLRPHVRKKSSKHIAMAKAFLEMKADASSLRSL